MTNAPLENTLEHAAAQLLVAAQTSNDDQAEHMRALAAQLQAATVAFTESSA